MRLREKEGDGLDEDLHSTTKTEDQVECALLLDVVIGEGAAVFELLAGEDKPLLVRGDSFLVLDFRRCQWCRSFRPRE